LIILSELLGLQHSFVAITFNDLAILYNNLKNWKQSGKMFLTALKCYEIVYGRSHQSTAQVQFNYATCCSQANDKETAKKYFAEAIQTFTETLGPNNDKTLKAIDSLAQIKQ